MYAPDGQARFAEPVNVFAHPGIFSWLPRIVIGSGDAQRIYVVWQEIIFSGGSPDRGVNGSRQGLLMSKLAVNARGTVALVNSTFAPGDSTHIWLWRNAAEAR